MLKLAHQYYERIILNTIFEQSDAFVPRWHEQKFGYGRVQALAFRTIHSQTFPLPHYCRTP
jgi:hypothetical protein